MYPTFMFHPTLAPEGRKFTDEAELHALSDEWVDTPTKCQPIQSVDLPQEPQAPARRRWTPKETAQ